MRVRRLALLAPLAALATMIPAHAEVAHARVVTTSPANGASVPADIRSVSVTFDDTVTLVSQALVVTGSTGAPLPTAAPELTGGRTLAIRLYDRLATGRYLVAWRVLADDGHVESGTFSFAVGLAGAPTAAAVLPAQPLWPVFVAAGLALVALFGAAVVVHRGLRTVASGATVYPDGAVGVAETTSRDRSTT